MVEFCMGFSWIGKYTNQSHGSCLWEWNPKFQGIRMVLFRKKKLQKKNRIWVLALTKSDFPFQQNQVLQILLAGGGGIQLTYTFIVPPLKKNYH